MLTMLKRIVHLLPVRLRNCMSVFFSGSFRFHVARSCLKAYAGTYRHHHGGWTALMASAQELGTAMCASLFACMSKAPSVSYGHLLCMVDQSRPYLSAQVSSSFREVVVVGVVVLAQHFW